MSSPQAPTVYIPAPKPSMFWTVVWGYGLLLAFVVLVMVFIGHNAITFQDADALREVERIKIREEVAVAAKKAMEDGPSWINKEKGVVRLPINQAMALTVDRLKIKKPRAGNVIEATPPAATTPAATTPAATTPAATTPAATAPAATAPAATTPVATTPVATTPVATTPVATTVTPAVVAPVPATVVAPATAPVPATVPPK